MTNKRPGVEFRGEETVSGKKIDLIAATATPPTEDLGGSNYNHGKRVDLLTAWEAVGV